MRGLSCSMMMIVLWGCPAAAPPPPDEGEPILEVAPDPPESDSAGGDSVPRQVGDLTAPPDATGPPPDATAGPYGLYYKELRAGYGDAPPRRFDVVTVNYTGWKDDGSMFDTTYNGGQALTEPVHLMLPGWIHMLERMVEGSHWRIWVPENLAYRGRPNTPRGTLVYEIELMRIDRRAQPPRAPADLGRPPDDAERRPSGLITKVLRPGSGIAHPRPDQDVEVNYTGWNSLGEAMESTIPRGRTATFPVSGVVEGWTEALQLMVIGEKRRLWIPEALGYKGALNQGMLVFDIELVRIMDPPKFAQPDFPPDQPPAAGGP